MMMTRDTSISLCNSRSLHRAKKKSAKFIRRLCAYVIPSIVFSICLNIPKYFEVNLKYMNVSTGKLALYAFTKRIVLSYDDCASQRESNIPNSEL